MKIVKAFPPNYKQVAAKFDLTGKNPIFCWGDTIYFPGAQSDPPTLPEHLIVHESVHSKQQNGDPESWWEKYLTDPEFCLAQEIPAYQAQFNFLKDTMGREDRRRWIKFFAKDLSSGMYGNMVTFEKAKELIKNA